MMENSDNRDPADLTGMNAAEAKVYIHGFITTLKLTEKEIHSTEEEAAKWQNRVNLSRSKGAYDLLAEAEKETEMINTRLMGLKEEEQQLKEQIDAMRRQLPGLAARERNIDVDLLEQELLMILGKTREEAATDKAFRELEKNSAAEEALSSLKAKMMSGKEEEKNP